MVDVIVLVDPLGNVLYLNPAAEQLLGSPGPDRHLEMLFSVVHPDDLSQLRSVADDMLNGGLPPRTVEYRCRGIARNGWRVFEAAVQRLLTDGVDAVAIVARDVTVQRAHELQRSEEQSFEVAAQASGAVARDVGALLLSFSRHLDLVTSTTLAEMPREIRALRETLDTAWNLIGQLQSFRDPADPQPTQRVDINDTLEDLAPHLERLAGPGIEIIQLLGASATEIAMPRAGLEELLSGLLLRAREAILAGLHSRPRELAPAARIAIVTRDAASARRRNGQPAAPGDVVIEINDTGASPSAEEQAQLETGAGGGDADVRLERIHGIVRQAGGRIAVQSDPIAGTTVQVRCPQAAERDKSPSSRNGPD
jgi:PAS domain S-box-containing protein